ncbi:family 20 glycosylhydrolase [Pontibacter sp. SGAir0037]|uniref:glycoside hydrolase family 20 protein n=1 Tax=Pontibacter sp. SGAir0037 TaxID=2571030 RepID=UPI0010CD584E|nr:family 20 glycosylhydrolase [Pontibacter sp. SGAir0037]QCR21337.1 beta-N-acetylhexosaminidase [Pontibacter sp. SGAir0037]
MKRLSFLFCLIAQLAVAQQISIIPKPASIQAGSGHFTVTNKTAIALQNEADRKAAEFLNDYLQEIYGFKLNVTSKKVKNSITLSTSKTAKENGQDAYTLQATPQGITIAGTTPAGTFYGVQSLIQMLPTERSTSLDIPAVSIQDAPRFAYRGMHLDVGRHMFPVAFVKKYIDYIALHKMNYFHWHLTEDQGWRIEIKKYPQLTQVGAFRNGTIIGRYPGSGNDNKRYGGFYTQEEVKEVVKYAADRHITVIPEIEMPGHSEAALTSYPWLGCEGTGPYQVQQTWGIFDNVYCAGKETTFTFLQDVLDEVIALFPSKYIHVGGDESPKGNWKKCPLCQKRIQDEKLADEHELQSYFIQRMEKYINSKGRTIIGWDEILEGGLAPNAIVMSWRGEAGGIEAAKQNHYVIMTPGSHVYLDHSQSQREDSVTIGGFTTVEKTYSYNPVPKELNADQAKYILGAQANVWTEYMKNSDKVEYMLFPRMSALSEVLWTAPEKKDWNDFENRLQTQFKRYDLWGTKYSKAYYDIDASVLPTADHNGVTLKMNAKQNLGKLMYSLQSQPAKEYTEPIKLNQSAKVTGLYYKDNQLIDSLTLSLKVNKATGKKVTLSEQPSDYFPGNGAFTLVDGLLNEKGGRTQESIGHHGMDVDATIDLGNPQQINQVVVHALNAGGTYVYPPKAIEVYGSSDGKSYSLLGKTEQPSQVKGSKAIMQVNFSPASAKFVKVTVRNMQAVPEGMQGAGEKTWVFLDEIEIH